MSEVVYSDLLNTSSASARTFISFMRPDFVKEKILLYNLLILRITGILKIMPVIDNPYGSRCPAARYSSYHSSRVRVISHAAIISFRRLSLAVPVTICIFAG